MQGFDALFVLDQELEAVVVERAKDQQDVNESKWDRKGENIPPDLGRCFVEIVLRNEYALKEVN